MEKDRRVSGSPSSFKGQMKIYAHKCNTADKKVTFMNLLKRILVQSKKPSGRFGRFLATGMNFGHSSLTSWGLGFIDIKSDIDVTDIGCGGGKLVKQLAGITTDGKVVGPDFRNDLKEVHRVMKQNGQFLIVGALYKNKKHERRNKRFVDAVGMTYLSIEEFKDILEGVGYSDFDALEEKNKGWFAVKCKK
jgi:SAM-dependent methyltransferase